MAKCTPPLVRIVVLTALLATAHARMLPTYDEAVEGLRAFIPGKTLEPRDGDDIEAVTDWRAGEDEDATLETVASEMEDVAAHNADADAAGLDSEQDPEDPEHPEDLEGTEADEAGKADEAADEADEAEEEDALLVEDASDAEFEGTSHEPEDEEDADTDPEVGPDTCSLVYILSVSQFNFAVLSLDHPEDAQVEPARERVYAPGARPLVMRWRSPMPPVMRSRSPMAPVTRWRSPRPLTRWRRPTFPTCPKSARTPRPRPRPLPPSTRPTRRRRWR
jgi:hypothetical protein